MQKIIQVLLSVVMALMMLVSSSALNGCSGNEEYTKVTVNKSEARFSFEYPVGYEDPFHSLQETDQDNMVQLYHPEDRLRGVADKILSIVFEPGGKEFPNAEAKLEDLLEGREHPDPYYDNKFQLLERSSTEVSGTQGEYIVYSFVPRGGNLGLGPVVSREVYFDHDGLIWEIDLTSKEGIADTVKGEFEHVLQTFKILD